MGPEEVTAAWLGERLGGHVGSVTTQRIGDGLVGMNLRVELLDADPALPRSVVLKLPSQDPTSRATGVALRNYEREVAFYLEVADTVDIRVPRCHHGMWDQQSGDFVLVLEDMAPAEQGDQVRGCTVDEAHAAVRELARLHGPRWDDPALDDLDWLSRRTGPDDTAQLVALWKLMYPGFAETFAGYLAADERDLVAGFGDRLFEWAEGRSGPRAVTHGDYRLDNLLFGTGAGSPPVTAVDWQTPGHGSPIGDLSYFLGAGLLPDVRRTHERDLLAQYVEGLDAYRVDVDERWLWEQYRREAFGGVIMAVIASQVVGSSARSEAMFAAMATRHLRHALDLDAVELI